MYDPIFILKRVLHGASTMLSFITLASSQAKTLPKVSYIKASEVWFLGCTGFIFSALIEFAFVNTVWRRKKAVSMRKVNSKYILKSTLTPRLVRKELQKELESPQLSNNSSQSCSSLSQELNNDPAGLRYNHHLTTHSYLSPNLPTIKTQNIDALNDGTRSLKGKPPHSEVSCGTSDAPPKHAWTTMTPQEIATWIDKRSRVLFPLMFLVFNIFYWTFVYCL